MKGVGMSNCRWHGSAREFQTATAADQIKQLVDFLASRAGSAPTRSLLRGESGSWAQSLPAMAAVLRKAELPDVRVLLEYRPYQAGNARADVVLAGVGPDGRATYVVIELKQWSAGVLDPRDGQVRGTGAAYEKAQGLEDPYAQAHTYAQFIRNYTDGLHDEENVLIHAAAFLHNSTANSISTLNSAVWEGGRRVYSGDATGEHAFVEQLQKWYTNLGDHVDEHEAVATRLLEAGYKQAPALLEVASAILTSPRNYPLSDEQKEIFDQILHRVNEALALTADTNQAVIVVKGGPGTGKTWMAMHLLGANARAGRQVSYATNSSSLRSALSAKAREGMRVLGRPVDALITSARTYWDTPRWASQLDVLMVDEAHRIAEYTVRTGHANARAVQTQLEAGRITQLFELKRSAKVLIAFIDEDQSITPKDDCNISDLEDIAKRTGASYEEFELTEQHRSGGSDDYEAWVNALLAGQPTVWRDQDNYTVQLADTPQQLESATSDPKAPGAAVGARLLAGFCWTWQRWPNGATSIDDIPYDIDIDGWRKRWNLRQSIAGYPKDSAWASTPTGAEQVGSVFTAQGFEFGRCGVIIGPDFRWDPAAQQWIVDVTQTRYGALATAARSDDAFIDLIRNHYRVLLTRAMAATVIYCTDSATRDKLAEFINP